MRIALTNISYSIAFSLLFSSGGGRGGVAAVAVANNNNNHCFGKETVATQLNFFDSTVTENKLHEGNGGVLRFENIGYVNDRPIDFVVKVIEGTTYSSTKASIRNGKYADSEFGQINIEELQSNEGSNGEGNFEFCLYDHENRDQLVTAESFRFSMYDVDERNAGANGIKEKITMDATQIEGFILYPNLEGSEIEVSCEDDSEDGSTASLPCAAGVRTIFHSTTRGTGGDNPTDPNDLDELQKKRSIVYNFKDTSCFTMTLSHYCPVDLCQWYGGGNFLFSGDADQLIEEGECITTSAQEEESEEASEEESEEEEEVTTTTTLQTYDGDDDDDNCQEQKMLAEKPILLETIGNATSYSEEAVQIISQDIDTVTFSVSQLWMEQGTQMISVHYRDVTEGDETCDMNAPNDGGLVEFNVSKEYTAVCTNGYTQIGVYLFVGETFDEDECESCSVSKDTVSYYLTLPCAPVLCDEIDTQTTPPAEVDCLGEIIEQSSVTSLDFFNSVVRTNTLHLEGGELRYEDIGVVRDRAVDLVVTVASGDYTDTADVWAERNRDVDLMNGKNGDFANINLQTVEGKPKSGEGNFKFCFRDKETDDVVKIDRFSFTVFDNDIRSGGIEEKMLMNAVQAQSFQLWPNIEDSEVKISCEDGSSVPCDAGVRTIFHSSTIGILSDNPTDPSNMTDQQKSRSIAFQFTDTDCFEFTYDHYCPSEQIDDGGDGTSCDGYTGGNFLFSGDSITDGECVLPPPPAPTEAPIVVTEPPAPPTCPDDVKLILQQGITPFPEDSTAVKIVSQDISTVTVKLEQAWTSTVIDSIYYEYKEDLFDSKCYEEVSVERDVTYATITIQCNVLTPTAHLHICVADDITKEFLQLMDDAIIPKCCHSTTPEDTPVVCYTIQINCETECVEATTSRRNLLRGGGRSSFPNE